MKLKTTDIYALILVVLMIAFIAAAYNIHKNDNGIAKMGHYSISKAEFYLYLYEQKLMFEKSGEADIWEMYFDGEPGENVAKQNALNSITYVRIALEYAKKSDITQTDEDKIEAKQNGQRIYGNLMTALGLPKLEELGITRELCERVSRESQVYEKVYALVTENYVLSEADFESYYQDFYINNRSSILSNSQELKERVREYYILQKKDELFKQEYNKLIMDTKTVKNSEIWNEISVFDFDE